MQHAPTLVIGDGGRPGTLDFTDVAETCLDCLMTDGAPFGPCAQEGPALAPASLVQVHRAPRFAGVPFRTAIVLDVVNGGDGRRFLLLWFWALGGSPKIGANCFSAEDIAVKAMSTTVETLPRLTRDALTRAVEAATAEGGAPARTVAPIAARLGL
ncbi:hypothetical protein ABTY59_33680 [Streptomyces sp. NPDC096079]|uniref:hypothetical protein n=1 Tax=Streptomyces sp. NPDC096079 TaxID=3155820 RepID=UPI00332F1580